ncbi:MAG: NAD(P)-dependent glycerol-1-phosphate dehydrogenase [Caldisphaeraceae archaeon]|nr:NAD(P)-dependent glycerol-1-phosphate dehydrogenase [Caldisphaeraceae archaeon]MEB3692279.1 NAD(P)-dependent glycerol-1-phosphate dehydrogenase [Caldisphaeraceae archaeon]MEB3798298.1 NAD(P)-dependent glycerol-1-phosphate dehydrogenase [Caldisphaeraceae archaeon]
MVSWHSIDLPQRIIIGDSVLESIGSQVSSMFPRGKSVLVLTGPNVYSKYYKKTKESLEDSGYNVSYMIAGSPTVDNASRMSEEVSKEKIDILLGLGGGRSIDIAKYVAISLNKEFISVPTAASHDGITSPFVTLRGFDRFHSRPAKPPKLILIDIGVIATAPKRHNAAGFGDLIGKYTSTLDWRLAHKLKGEYYGEYAASLALMSAKHVSLYAKEIGLGSKEGIRILSEALVSSGVAMCIAGSTRPASGSEHLFAHALEMVSKNPPLHGEAVGVGTIMMSYLYGKNWKKIRELLKQVGAPTNSKELGVSDQEVLEALTKAVTIRPERYTILGDSGLSEKAAESLARNTMVIS